MLQGYIGCTHINRCNFCNSFNLLTRRSLIPKGIKVKPVVRRKTRVMLQSLSVALHPKLGLLGATMPIQNDHVGKMFEINFVTLPPAIEPKKQNDRATHHGSKDDRAGWERSRHTQELTLSCLVAAGDAVT